MTLIGREIGAESMRIVRVDGNLTVAAKIGDAVLIQQSDGSTDRAEIEQKLQEKEVRRPDMVHGIGRVPKTIRPRLRLQQGQYAVWSGAAPGTRFDAGTLRAIREAMG